MDTTIQETKSRSKRSSKIDEKLRPVYLELRRIVRKTTISEARRRHEIGAIVLGVMRKGKTYGEQAVEKLAKHLGFDDSTLRNYASVAEIWTKEGLEKVLARRNNRGLPLRFSHLVVLAQVIDTKERERLMELALDKSMSVRKLEATIGRTSQKPGEPAETARNDGTAAEVGVRAALAEWESGPDQLKRKTAAIVQIARANPTARVRELLTKCAAHQRALADAATEAADEIEQAVSQLAN